MFHIKQQSKMKNVIAIIIGLTVAIYCVAHILQTVEPPSVGQWWTYAMLIGVIAAAIGTYNITNKDEE